MPFLIRFYGCIGRVRPLINPLILVMKVYAKDVVRHVSIKYLLLPWAWLRLDLQDRAYINAMLFHESEFPDIPRLSCKSHPACKDRPCSPESATGVILH